MSQKRQRVSLVDALYTTDNEGIIFLAQTQLLLLLLQGEVPDHLICHLIPHLSSAYASIKNYLSIHHWYTDSQSSWTVHSRSVPPS